MLTSFFKGFLLVGVLLWYSIAIMTVINDYFRVEFKDYLNKHPEIPSTKAAAETTPTPFRTSSSGRAPTTEQTASHSNHHRPDDNHLKTVVDMLQHDGIDNTKCASVEVGATGNGETGCGTVQLKEQCNECNEDNGNDDGNKATASATEQILNSNDDIIKICSMGSDGDGDVVDDERSICAKSNTVKWSRITGPDSDAQAGDVHS